MASTHTNEMLALDDETDEVRHGQPQARSRLGPADSGTRDLCDLLIPGLSEYCSLPRCTHALFRSFTVARFLILHSSVLLGPFVFSSGLMSEYLATSHTQ